MIASHVEGCSRLSFDGLRDDLKGRPDLLIPLLWICHNFRDTVYSQLCSRYSLYFDTDADSMACFWPGWPSRFNKRNHASYHFVKRLTLKSNMQTILSGKALEMLSRPPFTDGTFPRTRFIHFNIAWLRGQEREVDNAALLSDSETSIYAFVQRVKQLAPMVNHISVSPQYVTLIQHKTTIRLFSSLASQLFQLASCVEYRSSGMNIPVVLRSETLHDLTHITYDSKGYTVDVRGQLMQMVRQNAQTLQYLVIRAVVLIDVAGLNQDVDGNYIKYPNLRTLKLELRKSNPTIHRPVASGVAPFPNLRHLTINDHYPFGDDIAFRDNSATLEYLCIMPRRDTCDMLRKYHVFTPSSHPKLQCVKVSGLPDDAPNHFQSTDLFTQFILNIAPGASVRDIAILEPVDDTFHALDNLQNHGCIQVLVLPDTVLPLWFVVSLIKWLPLLSNLHCLSIYTDPLTEEASLDEVHAYVQSLCSLKNRQFRCLRLNKANSPYFVQIVVCIAVVTAICPNFSHIALPRISHNKFMTVLEEAIESGKYEHYEPHLRRLLFWK
ncbi:hypothetical protein GGH94_002944 [Coemansia aciculifera]|uniref:F-box domain-containing protein n=1 Tax=Coemansia aciculifera TaxID=417176 RepID=A0A9W8IKA4_9FUNG|nr:hypothetical protein GGH94_002944 [Coemansia aciculifera]